MKGLGFVCCGVVLCCLLSPRPICEAPTHRPRGTQSINRVLGDASFVQRFGRAPRHHDASQLRIATHLAYVERRLRRARSVPTKLRPQRRKMLEFLREYRQLGAFPTNDYSSGLSPVFVDRRGVLCAVAYLLMRSAGRAAVEAVNRRFQLAYIQQISSPLFVRWQRASGLSLRELAMIQPRYRYRRYRSWSPVVGLATAYRLPDQLEVMVSWLRWRPWFFAEIGISGQVQERSSRFGGFLRMGACPYIRRPVRSLSRLSMSFPLLLGYRYAPATFLDDSPYSHGFTATAGLGLSYRFFRWLRLAFQFSGGAAWYLRQEGAVIAPELRFQLAFYFGSRYS